MNKYIIEEYYEPLDSAIATGITQDVEVILDELKEDLKYFRCYICAEFAICDVIKMINKLLETYETITNTSTVDVIKAFKKWVEGHPKELKLKNYYAK